jgi:RHS repeat-associated protein
MIIPSSAFARTLSAEPSGGGLVENPDHTWTLYADGHVVKVYSSSEKETIDRVWRAEEFDAVGEESGERVTGISHAEAVVAEDLVKRLRTGEPYASGGEREVGEGLLRAAEANGLFNKRSYTLAGALREKFVSAGGPFAVSITIGGGDKRVITMPEWSAKHLSGEMDHGEVEHHPTKHKWQWSSEFEVSSLRRECTSISQAVGTVSGEVCTYAAMPLEMVEETWAGESKGYTSSFHFYPTLGGYSGVPPLPLECPGIERYPECGEYVEGPTDGVGLYLNLTRLESSLGEIGFPASGLGSHIPGGYTILHGEDGEEPAYEYSAHLGATSVSNPDVAPLSDELELAYALQGGPLGGLEGGTVPNPGAPGEPPLETGQNRSECDDPVDCATGNLNETQTDLVVGGRGVGLGLTRTYNSQAAAAGVKGIFGYGWSSSFTDHLLLEPAVHLVLLVSSSGATVPFSESGSSFTAPAGSEDQLSGSTEAGYTLTLPDQTKDKFSGSTGRLETVTDRDGNETKLGYSESTGRLEAVTDPAGRKLKFAYNAEGFVESVTDPMGHVVKYAYENETLASVTLPGEEKPRWQFKTDGSHQITEMVDGRGGKTINKYNAEHQVEEQTDPMKRTLVFNYESLQTKITDDASGAVTLEQFTPGGEPASVTHAYDTELARTESWEYNGGGYETSFTDANKHKTEYRYDAEGDRTSEKNADGDEWKWEYDKTHDVISGTTPKGEKTTIERETHGNPTKISRPAPHETTQVYEYKWASDGELESYTDPLKRTWKYEYDSNGDRTSETDPLGGKRTWGYDGDSFVTSIVSPRGHVKSGEESKYTTEIERDAQERPVKITDPLGHTTKIKRDADGNVEAVTDGNGHTTTFGYDADNERTSVKEPNGDTSETEYDGAGQVIAQINGDKHKTKYIRNLLEEITEEIDPLSRKTLREYDKAGNLEKLTDPEKRTTTYKYDPAGLLEEVSYSDGKTHAVKLEYDKDEQLVKMIDGTGTTTYERDQLERPVKIADGHGESVEYEWDLAGENAKLTYPNGKAVERKFDGAGRLEKTIDWLGNTISFGYDADSDQTSTTFPGATEDEDKTTLNEADQVTKMEMKKGSEVLGSLAYTRDDDGQVESITQKGLPGSEEPAIALDEDNRLTKYGTTEYKYDAANNPTTVGTSTQTFNEASELEKAGTTSYSNSEDGERTKQTTAGGPATTYGWNQASELTSVERPAEGETPKIEDAYAYNGEGLRTSETSGATTNYLTWNTAEEGLPLLLSNGTYSFIYGPAGLPIEQINNSTGTVTYLHHDQAGSTRLLTGSAGTVTGKCTYGAYGTPTCEGTTNTPLGYDAQYTSTDTGLIYMRARVYDPATAQFLTVDPAVWLTREPYTYTNDNPLSFADPSGRAVQLCVGGTVSLIVTVEVNTCVVITPHGPGITGTVGGAYGGGAGVNIHAGVGGSNAQTPGEYGGFFGTAGGSAQAGFGVYGDGFASPPGVCGQVTAGATAGVTAGIGAEGGVGGSYTGVIEF